MTGDLGWCVCRAAECFVSGFHTKAVLSAPHPSSFPGCRALCSQAARVLLPILVLFSSFTFYFGLITNTPPPPPAATHTNVLPSFLVKHWLVFMRECSHSSSHRWGIPFFFFFYNAFPWKLVCHRVMNLVWSPTSDKNSRVECECELETLEVVKLVFSWMSLRLIAWLPPLCSLREGPRPGTCGKCGHCFALTTPLSPSTCALLRKNVKPGSSSGNKEYLQGLHHQETDGEFSWYIV